MKFAATFVTGAEQLVLRQFKQFPLAALQVTYQEPGLLVFESTLSPRQLSELRYLRNVFVVCASGMTSSLDGAIMVATKAKWLLPAEISVQDAHTFRLRIQADGLPTALTEAQTARLQARITSTVALRPAAHKNDVEAWIMRRQSGFAFVGFRVPPPKFKRLRPQPGQLRADIAHLLGLAAGVSARDVVLDPFAGSGAIPLELIAGFSPRRVIAVDYDVRQAQNLQAVAKEKPSLQVIRGDALRLKAIPDASVTRVVTDPPWGEFTVITEPNEFYQRFLRECRRVLRPGGVAVVLCAHPELPNAIVATPDLDQVARWPILVSGKKATIYKLRKTS